MERALFGSHRQIGLAGVVLAGLAGGTLCFLLAAAATPTAMIRAEEHDLWLTQRLGFVLAPALALWLGWFQRSWRRVLFGGACALLTALVCYRLCSGAFQPVLLALPLVLAGVVSASCTSQRNDWLRRFAGGLTKGLLMGLLTGLVYIVLLSLGAQAFWPTAGVTDYESAHVRAMWRAGPLALGLSVALLLPLVHWAAGLGRPRVTADGQLLTVTSNTRSGPSSRARSSAAS